MQISAHHLTLEEFWIFKHHQVPLFWSTLSTSHPPTRVPGEWQEITAIVTPLSWLISFASGFFTIFSDLLKYDSKIQTKRWGSMTASILCKLISDALASGWNYPEVTRTSRTPCHDQVQMSGAKPGSLQLRVYGGSNALQNQVILHLARVEFSCYY